MGCVTATHSLPEGGFVRGKRAFLCGSCPAQGVSFGAAGEVVGSTWNGNVVVKFDTVKQPVTLEPAELSHHAPSLPAGYHFADRLYYGGPLRYYSNGDEIRFGEACTVAGLCRKGPHWQQVDENRLLVSFQCGKSPKAIRQALLFREPPELPGGYTVGDRVYWCGIHWAFPNGDKLKFGTVGSVAGRTCVCDGLDNERVAVHFSRNRGAVAMRLAEISREEPVIPGGWRVGDEVYYCYSTWRSVDGQTLRFGAKGEVSGRSCIGDGNDDQRLWVRFGGLGYGCISIDQVSAQMPVIPGGYSLGEQVYYAGASRESALNNDKYTFGEVGEIMGRATTDQGDVAVLFPASEDAADLRLAEISRVAPCVPEYTLGDAVFYLGDNWKYSNGDCLTYGARGEIVGRASVGDGKDDDRVAVKMSCNLAHVDLFLEEVSREPPSNLKQVLESRLELAKVNASKPLPRSVAQSLGSHAHCAGSDMSALRFFTSSSMSRSGTSCADLQVDMAADCEDEQTGIASFSDQTPALVVRAEAVQVVGGSDSTGHARREPFCEVTAAMRLAITYKTAYEASLDDLMAAATDIALGLIDSAKRETNLDILTELRRVAEDYCWHHIQGQAQRALQDVAMVKVLEVAESEGDHLCQLAVACLKTPGEQVSSSSLKTSLESTESLREQIQQLLDHTYTGWGGYGKHTRTRDRPNEAVAEYLEVQRVDRLQNLDVYLKYCIRRQVISSQMPVDIRQEWNVRTIGATLAPIRQASSEYLSVDSQVASKDENNHACMSQLDCSLNEFYLWHGTGPVEVESIARNGFDVGQAGSWKGSLFGRGLYFAESCLKADEYVRPDENGYFPLVLCRVTMGHVHYCDAEDPKEIRESLRASCRDGPGLYHSIIGDREKVRQTFREFVVFDSHQAYPEYVVWYIRKT